MRCLVTGATGYIGSNLCKALVSRGDEVACVVRAKSNTKQIASILDKAALYAPLNAEDYVSMIKIVMPDVVFHLAAFGGARHSIQDVPALIQSNIAFPTLLLDAMSICGVRNFVNIGSYWQTPKSALYEPTCLYAAMKQALLDILLYYVKTYSFNVVTLRLCDSYGAGDTRKKILNILRDAARTGEHIPMSPGEQFLDLVYIDDIVSAIVKAGELLLHKGGLSGRLYEYSISSKRPIKLKDLISLVEEETNSTLNIGLGELPYRLNEVMYPWTGGDWVPGWHPTLAVEEGIRKLCRG